MGDCVFCYFGSVVHRRVVLALPDLLGHVCCLKPALLGNSPRLPGTGFVLDDNLLGDDGVWIDLQMTACQLEGLNGRAELSFVEHVLVGRE